MDTEVISSFGQWCLNFRLLRDSQKMNYWWNNMNIQKYSWNIRSKLLFTNYVLFIMNYEGEPPSHRTCINDEYFNFSTFANVIDKYWHIYSNVNLKFKWDYKIHINTYIYTQSPISLLLWIAIRPIFFHLAIKWTNFNFCYSNSLN